VLLGRVYADPPYGAHCATTELEGDVSMPDEHYIVFTDTGCGPILFKATVDMDTLEEHKKQYILEEVEDMDFSEYLVSVGAGECVSFTEWAYDF